MCDLQLVENLSNQTLLHMKRQEFPGRSVISLDMGIDDIFADIINTKFTETCFLTIFCLCIMLDETKKELKEA